MPARPLRTRLAGALAAVLLTACGGGDDAGSLPPRVWSYLASDQAFCGNGTTTGFAVNPVPESDTLLLYLQGGGACWDGLSCYGTDGKGGAAAHFTDNVQMGMVLAEVADARMAPLFDRSRSANPFREMTQVYVPYCTGDLHAGTSIGTHTYLFDKRPAYHTGASNLDAFLKQLVPLAPQVKRVVLMGASAGGYGATFNWWRVRQAFGANVRVDVLDDSGPTVDPVDDVLWRTWRDAWAMAMPPDCPQCADSPTQWLPYYAATVPAPARYGLLSHMADETVAAFAYPLLPDSTLTQPLLDLRAAMGPRQKTYYLAGNDHVTIDQVPWPTNGSGLSMGAWVTQFLSDDPAWAHSGP